MKRNAIICHTMAGSLTSCDSWFANTASQVSSHYGVGLNGEAHQYVSLDNTSWANGRLEPGNIWQGRFGADNPNDETITIETEDRGLGTTVVTDRQYATVLALCRRALVTNPGMVVSGHTAISPQTRPGCPGARWVASGRLRQLADDLGVELFFPS
jgi:N-acetyl-anhydromuramyl-L-alanine amidase AmpD